MGGNGGGAVKAAFPFHSQLDSSDCGAACLRMVASHYGLRLRASRVRSMITPSREGVSIHAVARAADRLGFRTLPATLPFESLRDEVPLPAVVLWRGAHFIVVYDVDAERVRAVDPASGHVDFGEREFRRGWTLSDDGEAEGVALLLEPTAAVDRSDEDDGDAGGYFALFREVTHHLSRFRTFGFQIAATIVAASIIQLLFPLLTQTLVDQGIVGRDLGLIWVILVAQLALFVGRSLGELIRARLLLHVGARVAMAMRSAFVRKLTRLPVSFFDTRLTGDIDRRVNDQYEIQRLLTQTLTPAVAAIVNVVVFALVLAWYSPVILGIFVVGTVLYLAWTFSLLRRARTVVLRRLRVEARLHDLLQQIVQGIEDLKVYVAHQRMSWTWERRQAELFDVTLDEMTIDQAQTLGGGFINELKNIVITLVAAFLVVGGELTLGMMLAIQYIVGALNGPVVELQSMVRGTDRTRVALERTEELLRLEPEGVGPGGQEIVSDDDPGGSIVLAGVHFRYGGEHEPEVLRGLDLTIHEGGVTAVVGVSGSGKTTLVRLLLGFYRPTRGAVTVGGRSLQEIDPERWRLRCGVVLQDGYLFADTIARNIALGHDEIDLDRLEAAADAARILDFVREHPHGFNRVVGAEGRGLSGGQKQRLLIARAIYADPAYLFFDEATNALDAESERAIVDGLESFYRGRTVVTVAHRLSTVRGADQIVVLDRGEIVETGTHEELVGVGGHYYRLVKNQLELGE